jgi:eukaryotic-like serine/threonine-protein kinase
MFPQIFGKYVLEREIAAGGMARVFLATLRGAEGFEKRLVVKQIRPELAADAAFVQRFVGEAKTAVGLSHPNIVPVYELGVEQGVYYIAMEYCPGVTLADVLFETGPLEADEGAYVGAEVCRALDYAHRRASIVHRDVTPRNVLIDDEGAIRLIDFGIAAPVEASSGRAREVFGSPGHMPPEQLRGEELGPPADLFAVGVLLVEAWTGLPPFRRATSQASAEALRKKPPRIDAENAALAPLADIVGACLALDIKRRPARAEELGQKLREFLRNADTVAVARLLAERIQRMKKEQRRSVADARRSSAPPPKRSSEPPGETPKTPPIGIPASVPPVTRTFAAREELVVWTRRLSSAPPGPGDTKPLSAPVSDGPRTTRERSFARPARVAAVGATLLLAGATGLALSREPRAPEIASVDAGAPPPSPGLPPAVEPARVNPEEPRVPAVVGSETPMAPVAPALPLVSERRPVAPPPSSAPSSPPATSGLPVVAASATLRLTADPPAVVSVKGDGFEQTSSTPVSGLSLRPGVYLVTFRNETSRAPVSTRVVLESGTESRVHADFRAAVPLITQR